MTTAKKPQDRKPKAAKIERAEDVKGFDLLKPVNEVPVWDQTPLLSLVAEYTGTADKKGEVNLSKREAVALMGEIGRAMIPLAKDEEAFTRFATGKTALQDVMDLAIAWSSQLGEDNGSAKS